MSIKLRDNIEFPEFSGLRCYMMPFIQGRADSLPEEYDRYSDIIERLVIPGEDGRLGLITIDESFVEAGRSQRGYGSGSRTIHTEACVSDNRYRWGPRWGMNSVVELDPDLRVLIANSIADTCMVWNVDVKDTTEDGDLSMRAHEFPREQGRMMGRGEVFEIGIFTPHEPIPQRDSGNRQYLRIVGSGVNGRDDYFTRNPVLERRSIFVC